jgi:hypothetical protein
MVNAKAVLDNVSWTITEPVSTASIIVSGGKTRPLRKIEWDAKLNLKEYKEVGVWLLHSTSGSTKHSVFSQCAKISADSTVKQILDTIAKMTYTDGPLRIKQYIFFQGIHVMGNVITVNTGS